MIVQNHFIKDLEWQLKLKDFSGQTVDDKNVMIEPLKVWHDVIDLKFIIYLTIF